MKDLERRDWIRALSAHPAAEIIALAGTLTEDCELRLTRLPHAGLGLLQAKDGAFGDAYFLGEFPLAVCRVELTYRDGQRAEGGAQIMADDPELARALAILDAIFAARCAGWEQISERLQAGTLLRAEESRRRSAILAATRVNFDLLSRAGESEDAYDD